MKKMKNHVRLCALLLMFAMMLTACGSKKGDAKTDAKNNTNASQDTKNEDKDEPKKDAVKSDGYEKFSKVEIGMSEDEVNAILGEPTRIDKAYYYYTITVNGKDMEVEVWINTTTGKTTYKQGNFIGSEYRAEFADPATDLSKARDLEDETLKTYEDCAAAFKTPGYLTSTDEDGAKTFLWVTSNDGFLTVSFRADGTVKSYSGVC